MADRCRSCGEPIEWARTVNGGRIPLDPGVRLDGNIQLDDAGVAHIVPAGQGSRVTHFATCHAAAKWRRHPSRARRR
jgi:hypothetical protein